MKEPNYLILGATFTAAGLLTYGLCIYLNARRELRERFDKSKDKFSPLVRPQEGRVGLKNLLLGWISSFGRMALGEERTKGDASVLRLSLIQAGFRYQNALALFYGLKAICALVVPLVFLVIVTWKGKLSTLNLIVALPIGLIGYYLPNYILVRTVRHRQERIDRALPDVIDLMIVSLEAGLSLQSTLNRVADEVLRISKDLRREIRITNAELRTGIPRELALKNLGERTGVQSVKSLIALMIQSEKMGVSIAQSLRTHADFVRVQRGLRAEELAAKMPIKILFPTLFCVFPSIFIVVLGPAAIQIYRNLIQR